MKIKTMKIMLHTIEIEFTALESPTSPSNSSVNAGAAESFVLFHACSNTVRPLNADTGILLH